MSTLELFPIYSQGEIPLELSELSQFWSLQLRASLCSSNDDHVLTGPIPPELGQLQKLEILRLGSNWLTGPNQPEIGHLQNLSGLHLFSNQLTAPRTGPTPEPDTSASRR